MSWVATPFPIYIEVYFFNMLNHEAFEKHGDAPVMEEKGPYTFRCLGCQLFRWEAFLFQAGGAEGES